MVRGHPLRNSDHARHALGGLLLVFVLMCCLARYAQAASPIAPQVSNTTLPQAQATAVARVVMDIVSYVRWPTPPPEVRVCVVGPTEYADELLATPFKAFGRKMSAHRRKQADDELILACDVIYFGVIKEDDRVYVLERIADQPILTISEQSAECAMGAMICLNVTPQRIAFRVNLDAVARGAVKVHPSVLQLSRSSRDVP